MVIANDVRKAIRKKDFDKAYSMMEHLSIDAKIELLCNQVAINDDASMYLFLLYLVAMDGNAAVWHFRCFVYLVFESSLFNDSMCLAAWHAKNAMQLDNRNVEYKRAALSVFAGYPEQFFTDEEFSKMARDVIRSNPNDNDALNYIREHQR